MRKFTEGDKVKFNSHGVTVKGIITKIAYGQGGGVAMVKSWRGNFIVRLFELKGINESLFEGAGK